MRTDGDYISREAAIDDISSRLNLTDLEWNPVSLKNIRAYVAELINHVPAADVRPVVKCKECKYRNTDKYGSWCLNDYEHNLKDDDFCSRGKKK